MRKVMIGEGRMYFSDLIKLKAGDSVWEAEYGNEIQAVLQEDAYVTTTESGTRQVQFKAKVVGSESVIDYLSSENFNYPKLYNQRQLYNLDELLAEAEAYHREQQKNLG